MDGFRIVMIIFIGLFLIAGIMFVVKSDKLIDTGKNKKDKSEK